MQNAVKLDEIDHKIMNLLYENARISVSEIGRIISMTQPAVKERMNKLEDQGVIAAYRTKFEPSKINKNIQAFIMFKTSQCADFIQYCNAAPEVTDLYRISGEFNYMMKVMSDSMDSLAAFLDSLMQFGLSSPLIVLKSEFEEKLSF
ncbi:MULTISPECIES: Lrp/AsnC family transcriptional regulator [Bacillus]|uniref:Lrp/AsnC family transcriptional regulator n=1 Tax=Bacillus TaxID=1386 RepID=UPI000775A481|nr:MULTISPECIES: Lrp/AsnC family transcriptional regulator [Bacillus]KXO02390.1 AsnC family transcriptional regulator [Bacillus thuringiensis]KAB7636508.1 Lrp/AsnC family transcriptional regulator [Bacillus sp. B3-WWTP-C-10-D-3]MCU5385090.1 Lrp/AsnC family transcriptional regulator [Bacillus cereus]MDA1532277.1 Lrp/AsnC family transcriptional regulator [Bacillus cereus group sp. TH254-2LC]MDA1544166.1 Lrp/AsnC family transcriptional regulator [Bacillus cereus group sp. TH253LC]